MMVNIDLNTVEKSLSLGLLKLSIVFPMTKKSHFRLQTALQIILSDGAIIDIPKGFEFDGSSAPRFLWWLFPSYGDFFLAALIHDFMYQTDYLKEDVGIDFARKFADKEMLIWSNRINDRNFIRILDNYLRYYAVRLFGKKVYLR